MTNLLKVLLAIIIIAIAAGVLFSVILPSTVLVIVLAVSIIAIGGCMFFF